jgi:tripartite-type tricarboxylate transporter receptor subunit TctC
MIDRRQFVNLGLGAAAGLSPLAGLAQGSWPDKPVKIIVIFGAGGASDTLTRMLAERLQAKLGQPFVIENKTGAGGNIGMQAVAAAPPDGYTMVSATVGTLSINQFLYSKLGYDPVKDFAPVSTFWENCNVFAVSADHPAKTLAEFRTWAAARPKGVSYSSSGVGTTPHLAGELFGHRAGIKTVHVPFRSSATTEVMSGTIDFAIDNVASYTQFIKAGKVRGLAVTSAERWPVLPEIPTMAEAGMPDFIFTSWGALALPGATPPAIVERLSKAVQEVAREPGMQERFLGAGARFVTGSPHDTAAMAARERAKWREVVKLSGAKLD